MRCFTIIIGVACLLWPGAVAADQPPDAAPAVKLMPLARRTPDSGIPIHTPSAKFYALHAKSAFAPQSNVHVVARAKDMPASPAPPSPNGNATTTLMTREEAKQIISLFSAAD